MSWNDLVNYGMRSVEVSMDGDEAM